ncbi:MAG: hypothetical protein WD226_08775 [Planctomycetota bacterium]
MIAKNRLRYAKRLVAEAPTPENYVNLANEYVLLGRMPEVHGVCAEGLGRFCGNPQLTALRERALRALREERVSSLKQELAESPRPAVWRDLCLALMESGKLQRAEETALAWLEHSPEHLDAHVALSEVRLERYFSDRGREQGRRFVKALERLHELSPGDARELRLRMRFATRIGAFGEARKAAERLLRLAPGDRELEAQYRVLVERGDREPSFERGLHRVEQTGRFVDDDEQTTRNLGPPVGDVRGQLRSLSAMPSVLGAIYLRGDTALVQGWKGASAERMARGLRGVMRSSRHAARRLGLGTIRKIEMEGDFGSFSVLPGPADAGGVWCEGRACPEVEQKLVGLSGIANGELEEAA